MAVVAVGAPAYASSRPCVVQTNFDGLTPGTSPTTLTFLPSTVTATVAYASTGNGGDSTPGGTGQVAATTTVPPWNYIEVEMLSQLTVGDTVTVTITFTQAVNNLSFKIHDIDGINGQWRDQVIVNTPGFTFAAGLHVVGTGTAADPFHNSTSGDDPIESGLGDVQLSWATPVTVVQFTYRAGITGSSGNQHVGIGNLSFTDCVANPNGRLAAPDAGKLSVARGGFTSTTHRTCVPGRDN